MEINTIEETIKEVIGNEEIIAIYFPSNVNTVIVPGLYEEKEKINKIFEQINDLSINKYCFYLWTNSFIVFNDHNIDLINFLYLIPRNPTDNFLGNNTILFDIN